MPVALQIAQFAFAFLDRLPELIQAGIDIKEEYEAHRAKVIQLATAGLPPTAEDWDAMHTSLKPLEDRIQAAHRDGNEA